MSINEPASNLNDLDPGVRAVVKSELDNDRRERAEAVRQGKEPSPRRSLTEVIASVTGANGHGKASAKGNGHDTDNYNQSGVAGTAGVTEMDSTNTTTLDLYVNPALASGVGTVIDDLDQVLLFTKKLNGSREPGVAQPILQNKEMARRQLEILDPNATKFTFQFFSDNKDATEAEKKSAARTIHSTLDEVWPQVLARNTPQWQVGVFVTVNETNGNGRRKAEDIVRVRAAIADADSQEGVEQCESTLAASGVAPSMVVSTGRGRHYYWSMDDLPLDKFKPLQERLNAKLGTDKAVKDLPRVLRLAGTLHLKDPDNPRPITLHNQPGEPVRYRLAELVAKLGLDAAPEQKPAGTGPKKTDLYVSPELAQQGPSAKALEGDADAIGEGVKDYWFDKLTPEQKDAAVRYMAGGIAEKTKAFELSDAGGNNDDYFSLITALGVSGAPHAEDVFVEFASKAENADPEEELRATFARCKKDANGKITVGTLIHLARQAGVDLSQKVSAERGWMGYPAIKWRDFTAKGKPCSSLANAVIAIKTLGIVIRQDLFHHRIKVEHNGAITTVQEGILTDDTVGAIRSMINNTYELDCGREHTLDAIKEIARDHAFDPILDYLAECHGKWDGKKRIETWVIDYLGCEDTLLNRAVGRLMLIASVRRARRQGCKFDQICVLEGVEGLNKSTAIRVLAGDDNFSDQSVLNVSEREAQEQLEGVWLHESADLTGLRKAEVERVKAFASRQSDRARPAYARVLEERKRRCTQWATTNDDAYLASQTGNRRFWPLAVGNIDVDALRRDRDQLWGEAAALEDKGASIVLDRALWPAAAEEQGKRRLVDTWEDVVENMPPSVEVREGYSTKEVQIIYHSNGKELVSSADVLAYVLKVPTGHQYSQHPKRLAQVMKQCGWQTPKSGRVSISGKQCRGYWRDAPPAAAPEEWKEWLKEKPVNEIYCSGDKWVAQSRKVNGKIVSVKKAKTGFWYAIRGAELLGRAGCVQRFSTGAEACDAVDLCAAGDDGWEWIAWPDRLEAAC